MNTPTKPAPWQKLSEKTAFETKYCRVQEHDVITPSGAEGKYYVLDAAPSVFVVPVTPEGQIVLVHVYRYPTQTWSWEIPAGGANPDESLEDSARRELWEETGYTAGAIHEIGSMQASNGKSNEINTIYVAKDLTQTNSDEAAEDGIGQMGLYSWEQVQQMIWDGEITDAQSVAGLFLYWQWNIQQ